MSAERWPTPHWVRRELRLYGIVCGGAFVLGAGFVLGSWLWSLVR